MHFLLLLLGIQQLTFPSEKNSAYIQTLLIGPWFLGSQDTVATNQP